MRKISYFLFTLVIFVQACSTQKTKVNHIDLCQYVDPVIGTHGVGNVSPAASVPFGMVQLGPDTRVNNWQGNSGYHYTDTSILGFSHMRLSGTGLMEFLDILVMPTSGDCDLNNKNSYSSSYQKVNQKASPGYYKVQLDKPGIVAELTSTERCGFHKYTWATSEGSSIVIDLAHPNKAKKGMITIVNDKKIEGYRISHGWADKHIVYFVMEFSSPIIESVFAQDSVIKKGKEAEANHLIGQLKFDLKDSQQLLVKVGISTNSIDNAHENLKAEIDHWDFEKTKQEAHNKWNSELNKILVEGGNDEQKTVFYTALYHTMIHPSIYSDVNMQYYGADKHTHEGTRDYYHVFSLWDTYRSVHPLFTIMHPSRNNDFINSLLLKYQQGGRLPEWELASNDAGLMIGHHALPVIMDAFAKGIADCDPELAYKAMKHSVDQDIEGMDDYRNIGYVPFDKRTQNVPKTQEYAYNDWCVAQMAKQLGKTEDYECLMQRTRFYKNLFYPELGLMRPKNVQGEWRTPYTPEKYSPDYTETNAYQYSNYAPHDAMGLLNLHGGSEKFEQWLDFFFTDERMKDDIGHYDIGNEPTNHTAYLYNHVGSPWKTQKYIELIRERYNTTPKGIPGNDDCGSLSAWYVFSAMGFYPICPGSDVYEIGTPLFTKTTICLENGKTFVIEAPNKTEKAVYVSDISLDGNAYEKTWFTHADILAGGKIEFNMSETPNKEKKKAEDCLAPFYFDHKKEYVREPVISSYDPYFANTTSFTLSCTDEDAKIYYTLKGEEPTESSNFYSKPVEVNETFIVKAKAFAENREPSITVIHNIKKQKALAQVNITSELKPGLKYSYYERMADGLPDFSELTPDIEGTSSKITLDVSPFDDCFMLVFEGLIKAPVDGLYTFYTQSDYGSIIYIDD